MPIAIDNEPIPAPQQKLEFERLKQEVARGSHETPEQAERHEA